jgi:glutathione S-transferase
MGQPGQIRFVDVDEARAARGLRLVLLTGLPSPWSDGARGLFAVKGVDALVVRFRPGDAVVTTWTGTPNAPAVLWDDEPPRAGWAEIVALAERLAPSPALVPADADARVRMFGLLHELLGEGGLAWCRRLLVLHESLRPDDPARPRRGFPPDLARMLAARYGYAPDRIPAARRRLIDGMSYFAGLLAAGAAADSRFLMGSELTALDLYAAAVTAMIAPPPEDLRRIIPAMRPALEHLEPEVAAAIPPALLAHRDFVYSTYLREVVASAPPAQAAAGARGAT